MEQIFKAFSIPRPRFLQYLTVNLKVFACCSESLRKRFPNATSTHRKLMMMMDDDDDDDDDDGDDDDGDDDDADADEEG